MVESSSLSTTVGEFEAQLQSLIAEKRFSEAIELIDRLPVEERSLHLSRLDDELQLALLKGANAESAADILHSLPDAQAIELLDGLSPDDAADILEELPQSEQADLVGELNESAAEAILSKMDDRRAAERIRTLARYGDDVAGGIMSGEFVAFQAKQTVGQVVDHLRKNAEKYSDYEVQYGYVTDHDGRLLGVLRMRDLLLGGSNVPIENLMIRNPLSVSDQTHMEDLQDILSEHSFLGIPVISGDGRLTGVVHRAAVERALSDRNADDYLKASGIIREELRTMPLLVRSRRRFAWLSINIGLNVIAASVIALYQETLAQVIALAIFLPIISDMSGCSGNQAVAVSMRELSLGLIDPREVWRVLRKEATVGVINGFALGLLIGIVAFVWQGNAWLGIVVGAALMINTLVAVSLGGSLPLIMRRLGLDPALASGPILTTVTDMCGFLLVLSFASFAISKLVV